MAALNLGPRFDRLLQSIVALVFLLSGFSKGAHLDGFVSHLNRFDFVPQGLSPALGLTLCAVELIIGCCLLRGFQQKRIRTITAALLLFFAVFLMVGLLRGWPQECGCYGQLIRMNPTTTIAQDCLLVLMLAFVHQRDREPTPNKTLPVVVLIGVVGSLTLFAAQTHYLDRFLVRLVPGFELTSMPSPGTKALNKNKKRLAVFVDHLPDEAMTNRLKTQYPDHELCLIDTTDAQNLAHPSISVLKGKKNILHYYYHQLPTSFTVEDGIVGQVWYGRYPP